MALELARGNERDGNRAAFTAAGVQRNLNRLTNSLRKCMRRIEKEIHATRREIERHHVGA